MTVRPRSITRSGILVMFVHCSSGQAGASVCGAFVPSSDTTPEFLQACNTVDGTLPDDEIDDDIVQAARLVENFCEPHMLRDMQTAIELPAGASVYRIVTVHSDDCCLTMRPVRRV